jgi:hypothetical protein
MKHRSILFGTALLGLMAAAANSVWADWTYTSTPSTSGITVIAGSNGGASVALTGYTSHASGASIPVLAYETSTGSTNPISFSNQTFNLALKIIDGNNQSGTLNFNGSLNGSLTATTSSLIASLTPATSDSLTFDGHTYTVNIPSLTLDAPDNAQGIPNPQGYILANVTVANASGGSPPPPPHTNGTPEPTSLVLGSLGFSCFGVKCWLKRRRLTRTIA